MAKSAVVIPRKIRPIVIGAFTLTATDVQVKGRPSFGEWQGVLEFANRAYKAAGWWVAALLRYADTRPDYQERIQQVIDATGYSEKTVKNLKFLGQSVNPARRRADLDISHHFEVAHFQSGEEQSEWLEKAATEGWSTRELRLAIHVAKRRKTIEGQATLEGMYRVIYADPPWTYSDRPPGLKGATETYPTMTIENISKLPVEAHALPDSVLLLWMTAPLMLQYPGPREVGYAWGFEYKQQFIWDKVDGTFGHYTGGNHEVLTIWTRGSCLPDVSRDLPDSVQVFRKTRVHSAKPPEFRRLIEQLWTRGPYLELFGSERVDGWDVFGNDARLWSTELRAQHAK